MILKINSSRELSHLVVDVVVVENEELVEPFLLVVVFDNPATVTRLDERSDRCNGSLSTVAERMR